MRAVGAVAGLVVALAAAPAPAQPAQPGPPAGGARTSGLRAAVAAALAFGYAEGKAAALARFSIPSAPTSRKAREAVLDQLDQVASAGRDAYVSARKYGSPYWTIAAEVRIGDTFACQAEKVVGMPMPPRLSARLSSLPPNVAAQYRMVLEGLVDPLRRQAVVSWERAAESDASPFWSARARERLSGASVPDC